MPWQQPAKQRKAAALIACLRAAPCVPWHRESARRGAADPRLPLLANTLRCCYCCYCYCCCCCRRCCCCCYCSHQVPAHLTGRQPPPGGPPCAATPSACPILRRRAGRRCRAAPPPASAAASRGKGVCGSGLDREMQHQAAAAARRVLSSDSHLSPPTCSASSISPSSSRISR